MHKNGVDVFYLAYLFAMIIIYILFTFYANKKYKLAKDPQVNSRCNSITLKIYIVIIIQSAVRIVYLIVVIFAVIYPMGGTGGELCTFKEGTDESTECSIWKRVKLVSDFMNEAFLVLI